MIHYTYAFIYTSVHVFQQMRRYEYSVDQRETYLSVAEAESKFFLSSFCSKKKKKTHPRPTIEASVREAQRAITMETEATAFELFYESVFPLC